MDGLVLSFLWRSALVLCAAFVVGALGFRRCPARRHAILLGALLATPVVFALSASRLEWSIAGLAPMSRSGSERSAMATLAESLPTASAVLDAPARWTSRRLGGLADEPDRPDARPGVATPMACAWCIGSLVLLARLAVQTLRLRAMVRRATPVTDHALLERFAALARRVGGSERVRILACAELRAPAAAGIARPVVLIPAGAPRAAIGDHALVHELMHVARRDVLWHALARFVRAVFWFQPLVPLAVRALEAECERAVDLATVVAVGDPPRYAETLVHAARGLGDGPAAAACIQSRESRLRRRIDMVLHSSEYQCANRPVGSLAAASTASVCVGLFLSLGGALRAGDAPAAETVSLPAVATADAGTYRVSLGFESIRAVRVLHGDAKSGETSVRALEPGRFTFDIALGILHVADPVDSATERIEVEGVRAVPWFFCFGPDVDLDRVAVQFGARTGRAGEDFEIDLPRRVLRFLRREDCDDDGKVSVSITREDPKQPGTFVTSMFSASRPQKRAAPAEKPAASRSPNLGNLSIQGFGITLQRTDDRRVFRTGRIPPPSDVESVSITNRGAPGKERVLVRGTDYAYDPATGTVVLLHDVEINPVTDTVLARLPSRTSEISFPFPVEKGTIKVVLGDRLLEEGKEFVVDYERRVLNVTAPEFMAANAKYWVAAGRWSAGNHDDLDLVRRLIGG